MGKVIAGTTMSLRQLQSVTATGTSPLSTLISGAARCALLAETVRASNASWRRRTFQWATLIHQRTMSSRCPFSW